MFRSTNYLVALLVLGIVGCAAEPTCELRGIVIGGLEVIYETNQKVDDKTPIQVAEIMLDSLCSRGALILTEEDPGHQFNPLPENFKLYASWNKEESSLRVIITRINPNEQITNFTIERDIFNNIPMVRKKAGKRAARDFCLALNPTAKPSSQ